MAGECGRHAVRFLEVSLAHCPWHPSLSVERMQQASLEATHGNRKEAVRLMRLCNDALQTTHGQEHPLAERARVVQEAFKRSPDVAATGRLMSPWCAAVSRAGRE